MEDAEEAIYRRSQDLVFKLQDFDPNDLDEIDLDYYREKLSEIDEILQEIVRKIQNLVLDYKTTIEAQRKEYWNVQITKLHSDVKTHRRSVKAKILQIRNSVSLSSSALPNQLVPNDDLIKRQVEASEIANQLKRLEIEENKKLFDQN